MPESAPSQPEPETYELAEPPTSPPPRAMPAPLPGAGTGAESGAPAEPAPEEPPATVTPPQVPDPFIDVTLPAALAVIGAAITLTCHVLLRGPGTTILGSLLGGLGRLAGATLFVTPLLLAALVLTTRLTVISYGRAGPALLKLLAIALAPEALGRTVWGAISYPTGLSLPAWVAGVAMTLVLYWVLTASLFRLDRDKTLVTLGVMFVTRLAAWVLLGLLSLLMSA